MSEEPWKFASNTFLIVTENRMPLMSEILRDHKPLLGLASVAWPALVPVYNETISVLAAWDGAEQVRINAGSAQMSATSLFEEKIQSLTRKPNLDENSPIETWDATIRAAVPYQGSVYKNLLPHGRDTLTEGTYDAQISQIKALGTRLAAQVGKPALITLGTTVTAFYTALAALRADQQARIGAHAAAQTDLEGMRVVAARQLFRNTGMAMTIWQAEENLHRIQELFDMSLVRGTAQELPEAPFDTAWTPATRTLSTTAMPEGATRLEVWRLGPGGTAELLLVGEKGELSVQIPASITFDAGEMYQLWLQTRNSRGSSAPGPVQSWTAA